MFLVDPLKPPGRATRVIASLTTKVRKTTDVGRDVYRCLSEALYKERRQTGCGPMATICQRPRPDVVPTLIAA